MGPHPNIPYHPISFRPLGLSYWLVRVRLSVDLNICRAETLNSALWLFPKPTALTVLYCLLQIKWIYFVVLAFPLPRKSEKNQGNRVAKNKYNYLR